MSPAIHERDVELIEADTAVTLGKDAVAPISGKTAEAIPDKAFHAERLLAKQARESRRDLDPSVVLAMVNAILK